MASLRALSNDSNLRRFVVQATPTGVHLGTGSYGSVEEVRPSEWRLKQAIKLHDTSMISGSRLQ